MTSQGYRKAHASKLIEKERVKKKYGKNPRVSAANPGYWSQILGTWCQA